MGSHFMAVYACDFDVVRQYVGSGDGALVGAVAATRAGSALNDMQRQALRVLVDGTSPAIGTRT